MIKELTGYSKLRPYFVRLEEALNTLLRFTDMRKKVHGIGERKLEVKQIGACSVVDEQVVQWWLAQIIDLNLHYANCLMAASRYPIELLNDLSSARLQR